MLDPEVIRKTFPGLILNRNKFVGLGYFLSIEKGRGKKGAQCSCLLEGLLTSGI